ncbi:MAG: VOC family protein [Actinobacteria bacterium]|nr:VOC family protein [Actinomycetota bacterium]MBV8563002.1 VOC family protein [Actinomycetota bacterium]
MAQTVTPYLLYEDGEAAGEFLCRAFGFREVDRQVGSAGGLHLELETDLGGRIYLGTSPPPFRNPATVGRTTLTYVLVFDVDEHYERARREGAHVFEELIDLPFGHRRYSCADPEGHHWSFATDKNR